MELYHHVSIMTEDLECEGGEVLLYADSVVQVVGDLRALGFADVRRSKISKVTQVPSTLTGPERAALERRQVPFRVHQDGSPWRFFDR